MGRKNYFFIKSLITMIYVHGRQNYDDFEVFLLKKFDKSQKLAYTLTLSQLCKFASVANSNIFLSITRPVRAGGKNMARINLQVPDYVSIEIDRIAREWNLTRADVVRMALKCLPKIERQLKTFGE